MFYLIFSLVLTIGAVISAAVTWKLYRKMLRTIAEFRAEHPSGTFPGVQLRVMVDDLTYLIADSEMLHHRAILAAGGPPQHTPACRPGCVDHGWAELVPAPFLGRGVIVQYRPQMLTRLSDSPEAGP